MRRGGRHGQVGPRQSLVVEEQQLNNELRIAAFVFFKTLKNQSKPFWCFLIFALDTPFGKGDELKGSIKTITEVNVVVMGFN